MTVSRIGRLPIFRHSGDASSSFKGLFQDVTEIRSALNEAIDAVNSGAIALSSATPQPVGTASAGVGTVASRDDHVHGKGNLTDKTANETVSGAWHYSTSLQADYGSSVYFQSQRSTGFPPVTTSPTFKFQPASGGLAVMASSDWYSGMGIIIGDVGTEINLTINGSLIPNNALQHNGTTVGFYGTTPATQGAVGSTPSSRTAGAAYGGTEQTMLQEAHDMARLLATKLKLTGIVTT